jgi:hypothetical protein
VGTETYPKPKTPYGRTIGEQKDAKFAPDGASPEYQQAGSSQSYPDRGAKGPNDRHDSRQKSRSPFINGRGNKQVSAFYPKKVHSKFPSEGAANKLVAPMSRKPKQA